MRLGEPRLQDWVCLPRGSRYVGGAMAVSPQLREDGRAPAAYYKLGTLAGTVSPAM